MTDTELAQLLQKALANEHLTLQLKRQGTQLMIMINRSADMDLDFKILTDWFTTAAKNLPGGITVERLNLYSRVYGEQNPDWRETVECAVSKSAVAADAPATPPPSRRTREQETIAASQETTEIADGYEEQSSDAPLDLKQYRFIRNELLLKTSLPAPPATIRTLVRFFHQLDPSDKRKVLPLLSNFFKAGTPSDLSSLPDHLQSWMQDLQQWEEKKTKDASIWLSRYCAYPEKTLSEIGESDPATESRPPQANQVSPSPHPGASSNSQGFFREGTPPQISKAGRAVQVGKALKVASVAGNLSMASAVTLSLLVGMVFVLCIALVATISESGFTLSWLVFGIIGAIVLNLLIFFLSPWIMDMVQQILYSTQWISLSQVERSSPESAAVIRRVCAKYNLPEPRLGLIYDDNPTAFTYGSLPSTARLVVSQGLFTYLDDDEAATVYAHELGHIVHWDFAVMTLASTLVQITYLIYTYINDSMRGDNQLSKKLRNLALLAYIFYVAGSYLVLYLSRVREYFADHFAAEVTGNPNGLSRALVKIAYGILEVGERQRERGEEPSRLLEGTRALGIYDPKAATSTATAYRVAADPVQVGKVFLWDLFNPWAFWMELSSTHPLTGKRVRALTTYAEQLGLDTEFDMGRVVAQGKHLDRKRLYGGFGLDLAIMNAPFIGIILGILISIPAWDLDSMQALTIPLGSAILCGCIGVLVKTLVMYPGFKQAPTTTIIKAMSNPYASPLRGIPLRLEGAIIGRGDAGYKFGSDLKLQDSTGLIFLHYASRFGPLGNFLFGASQADTLIGQQGQAVGWFRRGVAPWVDLQEVTTQRGQKVTSHHTFWGLVLGLAGVVIGIVIMAF
ncbi:MAG: M48 family metalloprotease [Synechococcaceae cyanobacterium SM2_3_1]|nr:M48 family metalloprotease [Synechococcaceae cyanobacterium SM2_3_1]